MPACRRNLYPFRSEIVMKTGKFKALDAYGAYHQTEMKQRAADFRAEMERRRSVRDFSSRCVAPEIIEDCLRAAASAPSGANMQPWYFVAVRDAGIKRRIRLGAEREEGAFYRGRAPKKWLADLEPLGIDEHKPFLEVAPYLIVVFAQGYGLTTGGDKQPHYYVKESVGIAVGFLIAAVHHAGLVCLPYTPSRMGFLNAILDRPPNERAQLILVVGHPAEGVLVPDLEKKPPEKMFEFR
jgi:iodotyrosine deiodinase